MQQRKRVARLSIEKAMEKEYESEKNRVAVASSSLARPGAARRESIKKTRMLLALINLAKLSKISFQ